MGHDFDFCDSYLIPKDQKQVSFTVQSNRVPLIFCVLLYMYKTHTILNFMTHIQFQKTDQKQVSFTVRNNCVPLILYDSIQRA